MKQLIIPFFLVVWRLRLVLVGLLGFALVVLGVGMIYWPAGLIVAGILILADLIHLHRNRRGQDESE